MKSIVTIVLGMLMFVTERVCAKLPDDVTSATEVAGKAVDDRDYTAIEEALRSRFGDVRVRTALALSERLSDREQALVWSGMLRDDEVWFVRNANKNELLAIGNVQFLMANCLSRIFHKRIVLNYTLTKKQRMRLAERLDRKIVGTMTAGSQFQKARKCPINISTTQIYTHVDQQRLKAVHRRFQPRAK